MKKNFLTLVVGGLLSAAPGWRTDAADVAIQVVAEKDQELIQTNAAGPAVLNFLNPGKPPFSFQSSALLSAPGTATNGNVRIPGGGLFTFGEHSPTEYRYKDRFSSQGALDAAFPVGAYTQTVYTVHDGVRVMSLNLPTNSYPNVPFISNWACAQAVNPQADFTVQWAPFVGGTPNDLILAGVVDLTGQTAYFQTPNNPQLPGALTGTNTSLVIPVGTLPAGQNLAGLVQFFKVTALDTTTYPGAIGAVVYSRQTLFPLNTVGVTGYSDNFERFASGSILTGANYPPPVGTNAAFVLAAGTPTARVLNVDGSNRGVLDATRPGDRLNYKASANTVYSNQTVDLKWSLFIEAIKPGNTIGGFRVVTLTTTNNTAPLLFYKDNGPIVVFTNDQSVSSAPGVNIGDWTGLFDTFMKSDLTLDFVAHRLALRLNGTLLTNMPLPAYVNPVFNSVTLQAFESNPSSAGNRFYLDDVTISELPTNEFAITTIDRAGNDIRFSFPTLPCRTYRVDQTSTLATDTVWTVLTNITAVGGSVTITNTGAAVLPRQFYRVATPP